MNWVQSRKWRLIQEPNRHYVLRHTNNANTEINVPKNITNKQSAYRWLMAHPNKVANPTRTKPKGAKRARAAAPPSEERLIPYKNAQGRLFYRRLLPGQRPPAYKYVPPPKPKTPPGGWRYPAPPKFGNIPFKKLPNMPTGNQIWNMTCDQLKSALKSSKPLGKGRQGIVFEAEATVNRQKRTFAVKVAPRDLAASKRGERQPFDVEFSIQDAVQVIAPKVLRIYKSMRCENFITPAQINMPNVQNKSAFDKSKQGILLIELANKGSLDSWISKQPKVTDAMFANIISDILGTLARIQQKYPDFRHNDLHMQNIFVADRGFLIGDFGWSRLKKSGTNPAVNTANGTKTSSYWGVGPKTDERYDHHLFLNELLSWATRHSPADHPKTIEFLKRAIPEEYRGAAGAHVSEWRLKYGDPCPGLPSLAEVLSYPFLSGKVRINVANLKKARAALKPLKVKRISSVNLQKAKAKLRAPRAIRSTNLRAAKAKLKKVGPPKPKRITAANLKAAKARLKKVGSPKAKPRITAANLRAAKAKLRPPALKKKVAVPRNVLRSTKFNKMVEKVWRNAGAVGGNNYYNAWNKARMKVITAIENRLRRNLPAFSPSPPKPAARAPSPPKPAPKVPSPPKAKPVNSNSKLRRAIAGAVKSPKSGRVKIKAPNSGRMVYANGQTVSMDYLREFAARHGVNTKGIRSKADLVAKLFG